MKVYELMAELSKVSSGAEVKICKAVCEDEFEYLKAEMKSSKISTLASDLQIVDWDGDMVTLLD